MRNTALSCVRLMVTQAKVDESKNLFVKSKANKKHGYFISLKVEDGAEKRLLKYSERRKKGVYHPTMLRRVEDRARDPSKRRKTNEIEPSTQVSTHWHMDRNCMMNWI